MQIAVKLLFVQLLLLAFCFVNTPSFANSYAERFGALSYLKNNQSVMSEFGHRYDDPEAGRFFSRLAPEELAGLDQESGEEAGKIINKGYDPARYNQFLARHHFLKSPLIYEVRVRLFRRDAYWGQAIEAKESNRDFREAITTAFREHLILKEYYPESYQHSSRALSPEDEAWMSRNQLSDRHYISPVGGHLLTALSQRQYLYLILSLLIILLMAHRALKSNLLG